MYINCINSEIADSTLIRLLCSQNEAGEVAVNIVYTDYGADLSDLINCNSYVSLSTILRSAVVLTGSGLALNVKKI